MRATRAKLGSLSEDRKAMLAMLRDARAIVYRDSESFNEAAAVLEHVGQMLRGVVLSGLNDYKEAISNLGRLAPAIHHERVEFLFDTVRKARNDSVHSGDYIRHHSIRLVELLLMLEEGLAMSGKIAGDLMVQNPTIAELWHNVATARRAMLTNSFSFLPIQDRNGVWKLLSDVAVVRHLRRATTTKERSELLGKHLQKALDDSEITLTDCSRFSPGKSIDEISKAMSHLPVLIVEKDGNKERLLGILTAFDLL
jgi:CBS domain-containing protein